MKQTVKYIHIMVAVLVAAFAAGCTKDFDKINTDPTKINFGNIKASNMFEPIFFQTGARNQYYSWIWSNELVQVTAFTGGSETPSLHGTIMPAVPRMLIT